MSFSKAPTIHRPDASTLSGIVLDMDGVVTDTAEAHAAAWKRMFDEALARLDETQKPFDAEIDYRRHVDGKPRHQGCADFLSARGIELPWGSRDDAPGILTIHGLGNLKNRYFGQWLEDNTARAFPGTLRLLKSLRAAGLRCGLFTSSRNGRRVLDSAGVTAMFDAIVDGADAQARNLPGKPDPAVPTACAEAMGVSPHAAALVEDSAVGVEAGRRAGFALVVGIDRSRTQPRRFLDAGADLVVADCAVLRLDEGRLGIATLENLPAAEEAEDALRRRLESRKPAVFLDYDGTLTPIVENPDAARLSKAMRETVADLAERCPVTVISSRDLEDVRERVGLEHVFYSGSHGFEVAGPGGFRDRPGRGDRFLAERDTLALSHGRKVLEVRTRTDWHKGRAVEWLLDCLGLDRPETLPVYLGDDVTDEDAFEALADRGLGIAVRGAENRPTAADLAVNDIEGARRFLALLAGILNHR